MASTLRQAPYVFALVLGFLGVAMGLVYHRSNTGIAHAQSRVRCCDGTYSPTCTSNRPGCCSRHGGVCQSTRRSRRVTTNDLLDEPVGEGEMMLLMQLMPPDHCIDCCDPYLRDGRFPARVHCMISCAFTGESMTREEYDRNLRGICHRSFFEESAPDGGPVQDAGRADVASESNRWWEDPPDAAIVNVIVRDASLDVADSGSVAPDAAPALRIIESSRALPPTLKESIQHRAARIISCIPTWPNEPLDVTLSFSPAGTVLASASRGPVPQAQLDCIDWALLATVAPSSGNITRYIFRLTPE